MEKTQIKENIKLSFYGTVASIDLYTHFSSINGVEEVIDSFETFCINEGEWIAKKAILVPTQKQQKNKCVSYTHLLIVTTKK